MNNQVVERYVIMITPFNGDSKFMDHGQSAWREQNRNYEKALNNTLKDIYRAELNEGNHLIINSPEYFSEVSVIRNNRFDEYPRDLKIDKLAVPLFEEIKIPENRPGGSINENLEKTIEEHNREVAARNTELKRIMESYPLRYDFVSADMNDRDIWESGFQFVIKRMNTTGRAIRYMLGYNVDPSETDYVTLKKNGDSNNLQTIPVSAPVNKYYVKHVNNGDVFLGSGWDADENWQEALKNYLKNLKEELGVN
jgi:hypothetical protein